MGHFLKCAEHALQVVRCPQGKKTTDLSWSQQMVQSLSSGTELFWTSFSSVFGGSILEPSIGLVGSIFESSGGLTGSILESFLGVSTISGLWT